MLGGRVVDPWIEYRHACPCIFDGITRDDCETVMRLGSWLRSGRMLTESTIRAAKPANKPYKRFDGKGLYLTVNPAGSKLWRMQYWYGGREKLFSIAPIPR